MIAPRGRRARVVAIAALLSLCFALLLARAIDLAVLRGPEFARQAAGQHRREVSLVPHRGEIVDRRGELLALSLNVPSVYVRPRQLGDDRAPPRGGRARAARAAGAGAEPARHVAVRVAQAPGAAARAGRRAGAARARRRPLRGAAPDLPARPARRAGARLRRHRRTGARRSRATLRPRDPRPGRAHRGRSRRPRARVPAHGAGRTRRPRAAASSSRSTPRSRR